MPSVIKRNTVSAVILFAILLAPALAGCSVQKVIHDVSGGTVEVPGASIPTDFPGNVPLVSGKVISGAGVGDAAAKVWNVSVRVGGFRAIDDAQSALTGAGFQCKTLRATSDQGGAIVAGLNGLNVAVFEAKDNTGYIVNYTVTKGGGR